MPIIDNAPAVERKVSQIVSEASLGLITPQCATDAVMAILHQAVAEARMDEIRRSAEALRMELSQVRREP